MHKIKIMKQVRQQLMQVHTTGPSAWSAHCEVIPIPNHLYWWTFNTIMRNQHWVLYFNQSESETVRAVQIKTIQSDTSGYGQLQVITWPCTWYTSRLPPDMQQNGFITTNGKRVTQLNTSTPDIESVQIGPKSCHLVPLCWGISTTNPQCCCKTIQDFHTISKRKYPGDVNVMHDIDQPQYGLHHPGYTALHVLEVVEQPSI